MTTDITDELDGLAPARSGAPRWWRAAEGISTLGTRLSFAVIAWSLLVETTNWVMVGVVLSVQAAAYVVSCPVSVRLLDRVEADRVSVTADLVSAVAIAVVAFVTTDVAVLTVLVATVGAARATSDLSKNMLSGAGSVIDAADVTESRPPPPREWVIRPVVLVVGGALGAFTAWLGPAGALWLVAMSFVLCALIVVLANPAGSVGLASPPDQPGDEAVTGPFRQPIGRRMLAVLSITSFCAYLATVTLVSAWVRGVFASTDALGLVGGALLLGALAGSAVINSLSAAPSRYLLLVAGYLAGGATVAVLDGVVATRLIVVVVAVLAGAAVASVTPVVGFALAQAVPAGLRTRAGSLVSIVTAVGVVPATFTAGWIVVHNPLTTAVAVAGAALTVAMLVPVLGHRTWQRATPSEPEPAAPVLRRTPKLSARLSVTLAYADGRWLVELRRGRALLGKRYLVKPADALTMLAQLDVPALNQKVEEALTTDKTEAVRQVDRMRAELAELEAKLEGLTEMVDLSDGGKDRLP